MNEPNPHLLRCNTFSGLRMFEFSARHYWGVSAAEFNEIMTRFSFGAPRAFCMSFEEYVRTMMETNLIADQHTIQYHNYYFDPRRSPQVLTCKGAEIAKKLERVFTTTELAIAVLNRFSYTYFTGEMTHRLFTYTTKTYVVNPQLLGHSEPAMVAQMCVHIRVASLHPGFNEDYFKKRLNSMFSHNTVNMENIVSTLHKVAEVRGGGGANVWRDHPTVHCQHCGSCRPVNGAQILINAPTEVRFHAMIGLKGGGNTISLWKNIEQWDKARSMSMTAAMDMLHQVAMDRLEEEQNRRRQTQREQRHDDANDGARNEETADAPNDAVDNQNDDNILIIDLSQK